MTSYIYNVKVKLKWPWNVHLHNYTHVLVPELFVGSPASVSPKGSSYIPPVYRLGHLVSLPYCHLQITFSFMYIIPPQDIAWLDHLTVFQHEQQKAWYNNIFTIFLLGTLSFISELTRSNRSICKKICYYSFTIAHMSISY